MPDDVTGIERVQLARPGRAPAHGDRGAHAAGRREHDGAPGRARRVGPMADRDPGDRCQVGRSHYQLGLLGLWPAGTLARMAKPEPPTTPVKVLVVDDEDGIRQALDRFLTRLGYRVLQAANAAEALERQASEAPQVMLSDIRMPNMSGVELVPKALAHDSDLAIVMLTAIDEPRTAIECLKLGAYDYLIKPVDLDELELSLQGALRQRQLEVERRELEQWLAREVAVRTQELEDHTTAIAQIALDAVAATKSWPGERQAVEKLAAALGNPADEIAAEVRKRRG